LFILQVLLLFKNFKHISIIYHFRNLKRFSKKILFQSVIYQRNYVKASAKFYFGRETNFDFDSRPESGKCSHHNIFVTDIPSHDGLAVVNLINVKSGQTFA